MNEENYLYSLTTSERLNLNQHLVLSKERVQKAINEWIARKSLVSRNIFFEKLSVENRSELSFAKSVLSPSSQNKSAIELIAESDWYKVLEEIMDRYFIPNEHEEINIFLLLHPVRKYLEKMLLREFQSTSNIKFAFELEKRLSLIPYWKLTMEQYR